MKHESSQLLSAFIDGEDVDPGELADALAHPGARETLRDFAILRSVARDDGDRPGPAFYTRMERLLTEDKRRTTWWRRAVLVPAPALAAAVVIGVLLVGWATLPFRPATSELLERPPEPDRVLEFVAGVDWDVKNAQERP